MEKSTWHDVAVALAAAATLNACGLTVECDDHRVAAALNVSATASSEEQTP